MYELETKIELMSVMKDARITFDVDDSGISFIQEIEIVDDEGDTHSVYGVFKHCEELAELLNEQIMDESDDWELC